MISRPRRQVDFACIVPRSHGLDRAGTRTAPCHASRDRSVLAAPLLRFESRGRRAGPRHAACSRLAGTRRRQLAAGRTRPDLLIHLGPELRGRLPELVSLGHGHRYSPVYELRNFFCYGSQACAHQLRRSECGARQSRLARHCLALRSCPGVIPWARAIALAANKPTWLT